MRAWMNAGCGCFDHSTPAERNLAEWADQLVHATSVAVALTSDDTQSVGIAPACVELVEAPFAVVAWSQRLSRPAKLIEIGWLEEVELHWNPRKTKIALVELWSIVQKVTARSQIRMTRLAQIQLV